VTLQRLGQEVRHGVIVTEDTTHCNLDLKDREGGEGRERGRGRERDDERGEGYRMSMHF
jgi:hypothetical protein